MNDNDDDNCNNNNNNNTSNNNNNNSFTKSNLFDTVYAPHCTCLFSPTSTV